MNGKENTMETSLQSLKPGYPGQGARAPVELALNTEETGTKGVGKGLDFKAFGKDGFTFFDFLDIINPLQHIPLLSTLYRNVTGDEIDPGARIAGATLFGGPAGLAISSLNVMVKHSTGKDVGDHMMAFLQEHGQNDAPGVEDTNPVQVALATAADYAALDATRTATQQAASAPSPGPATSPTLGHAYGMTGIPIAKAQPAESNYVRRAAPDLQLLDEIKAPASPEKALGKKLPIQVQAKSQPASAPADIERLAAFETAAGPNIPKSIDPRSLLNTTPPAAKIATLKPSNAKKPQAKLDEAKLPDATPIMAKIPSPQPSSANPAITLPPERTNGWVHAAMLKALDKYQNGAQLAKPPIPANGEKLSVTR